jgi:hypothetical protein
MKKRKKTRGLEEIPNRNPVAKFAHNFNKVQIFKDRSKYCRKVKYKNREPLPILFTNNIGKGFFLFLNGKFETKGRTQKINGESDPEVTNKAKSELRR